jgi:hypothetical protein
MSELPNIGFGKVYTYKKLFRQDIPNSIIDFTANTTYQDFTIIGIPANHMIMAVKMKVLVNFDFTGNTAIMYVAEQNVLQTPPVSAYVNSVPNCYGIANLTIPSGSDATYQYGSFRWFSLSTPGSNSTISSAYCLPRRTDAHDIIARVAVTGGTTVSSCLAGAIEVTVQYTSF